MILFPPSLSTSSTRTPPHNLLFQPFLLLTTSVATSPSLHPTSFDSVSTMTNTSDSALVFKLRYYTPTQCHINYFSRPPCTSHPPITSPLNHLRDLSFLSKHRKPIIHRPPLLLSTLFSIYTKGFQDDAGFG